MNLSTATSSRRSQPRRVAHWILVGTELFVAVGAVYGGVGLVADNAIHISDEWLTGTPFNSWLLPGVFLLLVVATPMTVAAVAELRRLRWAREASLLAGAAQIGWILAQWLIMQRFFVLQPIMLTAGVVVLLLAWAVHRGGESTPRGTGKWAP